MGIGPKLGSGIFASGSASKHETMTIKSSQALPCALKARVTLAQGEALGSFQRPRQAG
jgi:hypothetical protein